MCIADESVDDSGAKPPEAPDSTTDRGIIIVESAVASSTTLSSISSCISSSASSSGRKGDIRKVQFSNENFIMADNTAEIVAKEVTEQGGSDTGASGDRPSFMVSALLN